MMEIMITMIRRIKKEKAKYEYYCKIPYQLNTLRTGDADLRS